MTQFSTVLHDYLESLCLYSCRRNFPYDVCNALNIDHALFLIMQVLLFIKQYSVLTVKTGGRDMFKG